MLINNSICIRDDQSLHLFEYLDEVRVRVQPVEEEGGDGAHGDPAHAAGHERAVPGVRRWGGRGMN